MPDAAWLGFAFSGIGIAIVALLVSLVCFVLATVFAPIQAITEGIVSTIKAKGESTNSR